MIELIGQGGMGHVYRAEHLALRRHVALKIIKAAFVGDREVRFAREAATLARLDHRACVRILDYGRAGKYLFLAMELIEGRSLARILVDDGALPEARATHIVREILAGLAHAHAHGVLHRDVKPENVMVGTDGRVVVIDFGLARALDDAALTARGTCYGSPAYLAPERLLGTDYDARADMYSAGIILYELLAGTRPFPGATPVEILRRTMTGQPAPIEGLSRALAAIVRTAIARDPDDRFASAEAMRVTLEDLASIRDAGATMLAMTPTKGSWMGRIWRRLRGRRWELSGAIG